MSDLFPERIETDRLLLERLSHESVDVRAFYRVCSRHEPAIDAVTKHLTWEPHATPKETKGFVDAMETQWDRGESATYVIRPREPEPGAGEIAGACGLTVDWERRTGTLGVWLREPFWGRGYSGERATALAALAFERLDLQCLAVTHEAGNEKSRRAIEKYVERLGGRYDGLVRNADVRDGEAIDRHRYTVSRAEYVG